MYIHVHQVVFLHIVFQVHACRRTITTLPQAHWVCNQDSLFTRFSPHSHPLCLRTTVNGEQGILQDMRGGRNQRRVQKFEPKREKFQWELFGCGAFIVDVGEISLFVRSFSWIMIPWVWQEAIISRRVVSAKAYGYREKPMFLGSWIRVQKICLDV